MFDLFFSGLFDSASGMTLFIEPMFKPYMPDKEAAE